MRLTTICAVAAAAILSTAAMAQSSSVFGGFSYLRNSQNLSTSPSISSDLLGWQASYTYKIVPHLGITADFGGNYASAGSSFFGATGTYQQHTFLAGPEAKLLTDGRFQVGVRGLAGFVSANNPYADYRYSNFGGDSGRTRAFAASFGGNVDVKITDRVSYRLLQPEYLLTRFGNSVQNGFRVSTGFVFRF